jgi:putative transposase
MRIKAIKLTIRHITPSANTPRKTGARSTPSALAVAVTTVMLLPRSGATPSVARWRGLRIRSQGQTIADAIRQIGVSEVTYYRWRQEFGGLKIEQVKRLKELELENSRLRKAISDFTLDKPILQEAARGNY